MFTDVTKKLYNSFMNDTVLENLSTKHERILHITKTLDFGYLTRKVCQKVNECHEKHSKDYSLANPLIECCRILYAPDASVADFNSLLYKLSLIIINAEYGGNVFVDAYNLRAKSYLKLSQFQNSLLDIEIAIKYGGLDQERIMVKAISLYSLSNYKQLKDFLKVSNINSINPDTKLETEFDKLGYGHLKFSYLQNFVNDPNFANRTIKPFDLLSEFVNDQNCMDSLDNFEANYEMDPRCKIENDSYKGRHFVAKDFIPKGSTLLIERSFSLVLDSKCQFERCLYCNKECQTFVPCQHCNEAIFCSESCLNYAWKVFHRFECSLLGVFKDTFNASLHMYRTVARYGIDGVGSIFDEFNTMRCKPDTIRKAKEASKSANSVVCDKIIDSFVGDENLRLTTDFRQTKEQKLDFYRMHSTLLDHNEKYEVYYDVCYMGFAVDVALLLLLNQYLLDQYQADGSESYPSSWQYFDLDEINTILENDETGKTIFSYSFDVFYQLVEIIQLNIRKLSTNVFSWNIYDSNCRIKKTIATCQCLVGSLINHSCDPNVEWDFQNGCIIYSTLRDIEPGQEINNSYGPYKWTQFIERQMLLANNYYFNCRCEACKEEVAGHPNVLKCQSCNGPVVCIQGSYIEPNCMECLQEYSGSTLVMKKVIRNRAKFHRLLHFYPENYQIPEIADKDFKTNFMELFNAINADISYGYSKNVDLQKNLELFCRVLHRLGRINEACYYGQFITLPSVETVSKESDSDSQINTAKFTDDLQNSLFWFRLYHTYVDNCHKSETTLVDSELIGTNPTTTTTTTTTTTDPYDHKQLLTTAKQFIVHHFTNIRRNVKQLNNIIGRQNVVVDPSSAANQNSTIIELCSDSGLEVDNIEKFESETKPSTSDEVLGNIFKLHKEQYERSISLIDNLIVN